jgi:hypothetical protein
MATIDVAYKPATGGRARGSGGSGGSAIAAEIGQARVDTYARTRARKQRVGLADQPRHLIQGVRVQTCLVHSAPAPLLHDATGNPSYSKSSDNSARLLAPTLNSERAIRWSIASMALCCDPLVIALTAAIGTALKVDADERRARVRRYISLSLPS